MVNPFDGRRLLQFLALILHLDRHLWSLKHLRMVGLQFSVLRYWSLACKRCSKDLCLKNCSQFLSTLDRRKDPFFSNTFHDSQGAPIPGPQGPPGPVGECLTSSQFSTVLFVWCFLDTWNITSVPLNAKSIWRSHVVNEISVTFEIWFWNSTDSDFTAFYALILVYFIHEKRLGRADRKTS